MIRLRALPAALSPLLLLLPAATLPPTQDNPRATAEVQVERPANGFDEAAIAEEMQRMRRGQRAMRGLVEDPVANRDALLQHIADMQQASIASMALPLRPREELSPEEMAVLHVGYKQTLHGLLGVLLDMELAVLQGDAEALGVAFPKLNATKKLGHDTYQ